MVKGVLTARRNLLGTSVAGAKPTCAACKSGNALGSGRISVSEQRYETIVAASRLDLGGTAANADNPHADERTVSGSVDVGAGWDNQSLIV
jgi:hypothetical protein